MNRSTRTEILSQSPFPFTAIHSPQYYISIYEANQECNVHIEIRACLN